MKRNPSVFRLAFTASTVTAICLGVCSGIARGQDTSTTNVGAPQPAAPSMTSTGQRQVYAAPGVPAQGPGLPYGVGEVLKMYQGGINKDVIVNFINNTTLPYHLTADGIIYLQTLGVPQEITKAMILRDGQLQQQQVNQAPQQPYYPPQAMQGAMPYPGAMQQAPPPVQVAMPSTPPPDVTVIGAGYPDYYGYGYPDYGYGYGYGPYWPPVVIGGWGGWGWGYGGFRGGFGGFRGGGFGGFRGGGLGGGFHGGGVGGGFHGGGVGGGHAGGGGGGGHR